MVYKNLNIMFPPRVRVQVVIFWFFKSEQPMKKPQNQTNFNTKIERVISILNVAQSFRTAIAASWWSALSIVFHYCCCSEVLFYYLLLETPTFFSHFFTVLTFWDIRFWKSSLKSCVLSFYGVCYYALGVNLVWPRCCKQLLESINGSEIPVGRFS